MAGKCNEWSDAAYIRNDIGNGSKGDPINMSKEWLLTMKFHMSQQVQRQGGVRVRVTNMKKFDL